MRVLIVDDEADLADVLVERLRLRDIRARGVHCGMAALRTIRNSRYDVAVVDVKMPEIGGIELLKLIRQLPDAPPVVLMTGHGSAEDARQGRQLGAFEYLVKPVRLDDLLEVLHAAAAHDREEKQ
jgi:DNA-binding NtrC family response regulator